VRRVSRLRLGPSKQVPILNEVSALPFGISSAERIVEEYEFVDAPYHAQSKWQRAGGRISRRSPPRRATRRRSRLRETTALAERKQGALVVEREALHVEPAAEARERTVSAEHAMARQDDRKRVTAIRRAHRSGCVAAEPEPARLLTVAHGLSVGNGLERKPAATLELGPVQLERQVQRQQFAVEIGRKLADGLSEDGRSALRADPAAVESTARRPASDAISPSGPMGLSTTVRGTS